MTKQVNVAEAKTQLSRLLDAASAGDDIVIAKAGRPVARLVPIHPPPGRTLGFLAIDAPDDAFVPLTGEDLEAWE